MAVPFEMGDMAQHSLRLLRGRMVARMVAERLGGASAGQAGGSGGISLQEYVLGKPGQARPVAAVPPLNQALSGLLLDDAAALRRQADSLREGAAIAGLAADCLMTVQEKVSRMREIVSALYDPALGAGAKIALCLEYNRLAGQIADEVRNARYEDIPLMDGGAWAGCGRVTPDAGGEGGRLALRAGGENAALTLYNIAPYTGFKPSDTEAGALTATARTLAEADELFGGMRESYAARAGLYAAEAAACERKADILDEAGRDDGSGRARSPQAALLEILTRDQGRLCNLQS